jgi:hypothetical protein
MLGVLAQRNFLALSKEYGAKGICSASKIQDLKLDGRVRKRL